MIFCNRGANQWHKQPSTIGLLPLFHIYGITTTMNIGLKVGAKIVTLPKFDAQQYINALAQHKVIKGRFTWAALSLIYMIMRTIKCVFTLLKMLRLKAQKLEKVRLFS
jgi:acyl-CoA synthetase (AMP-forming)/AMP-acid ligase II